MQSEADLISACYNLQGKTLLDLAWQFNINIPAQPILRKGLFGKVLEQYFAISNKRAAPDFENLGIELKTLPLGQNGLPNASTFITYISLGTHHTETWLTSRCLSKIKRILWIPIEADALIPFTARRIGMGFLWSPSLKQLQALESDWLELSELIIHGDLDKINARHGNILQVRPKASNNKALTSYLDNEDLGNKTLPRGFYLRREFTKYVFEQYLLQAQ
jgi:DNA mismatch repair protein MutH